MTSTTPAAPLPDPARPPRASAPPSSAPSSSASPLSPLSPPSPAPPHDPNGSPAGSHPWRGLALCGALATLAIALEQWPPLRDHGLGALTLAIVLGLVAGNAMPTRALAASAAGIDVARQRVLRLGVVLYGLQLSLQDVARVGWHGVAVDTVMLGSTFALAWLCGTRWLRLDRRTAMLIGAGSAICGAAAVLATAPVVKARTEQVTVAVATVVVFGTLSIFVYPLLYDWQLAWRPWPADAQAFGLYIGSTVHEVAQVVAAGRAIGPQAADTAIIAKMVRVMMLAPFLLALSAGLSRYDADAARATAGSPAQARPPIGVPWFAFGFIGVVLARSALPLSARFIDAARSIDLALLATAMAALGASTRVQAIRQAGTRPLALATLLFVWLVAGGALVNRLAA